MSRVTRELLAVLAICAAIAPRQVCAQTPPPAASQTDGIDSLLHRLEPIVQAGDIVGYLDLVAGATNRARATDFARAELQPGATRVAIRERDRVPFGSSLDPTGYRVVVDTFVEFANRARVAT